MVANASHFQAIILKNKEPELFIVNNEEIIFQESVKLLGVHLDKHLNFHHLVQSTARKARAQLQVVKRLSHHLDKPSKLEIF